MSSRMPPREEDRVRRNDAVVPEAKHRGRVDLEVEVRRSSVGVAGRPDEPDDVTAFTDLPSTASGEYAERCA